MARRYISPTEKRRRSEARYGALTIAITLAAFAAMLVMAYHADSARGITVSQSLEQWGF